MAADGRTCQDIDECVIRTANCHGADDICINTRGGYKCQAVSCPKGFVKAPVVGNRNNNVKCQRKTFLCPQGDVECLYAPLSYSTNFISFPSRIRIPADLFTMRGPLSPYRRLVFDLKLISAADPRTGAQRVTRSHFNINQLRDNEAVIQLTEEVEGPQDIELQLDMNIYSREFQQNNEEVFFGTAVARIYIYVTRDDW
jgi:fibulin 1/2